MLPLYRKFEFMNIGLDASSEVCRMLGSYEEQLLISDPENVPNHHFAVLLPARKNFY